METTKKRQVRKIRALVFIQRLEEVIKENPHDETLGRKVRSLIKIWQEED
mgnify:CR=1 FL=1|tara:strand:- start:284 stop:433 length:150 start_codon:yes stop_codon:yes gene_type:complete